MLIDSLYLDGASTTKVHPEIVKDVNLLLKEYYGNADSLHALGQRVSGLVTQSRKQLASTLGVLEHEVIFTSGASESNAAAIKGIVFANRGKKHIITSNIEHSSVEETMVQLEMYFDYEVERLAVNEAGYIEPEVLKNALRADTVLVSIMGINNEIGSVFKISEYAAIIKKYSSAFFHVDGVQMLGKHDTSLRQVDAMSFSAHKINGLKGSGLLVLKAQVPFMPLIPGGQQEFGKRGGTLNSIGAIVWAKTLRLALDSRKSFDYVRDLWDYLWVCFENVEGVIINSPKNGSPYIFNLSVVNVGSEIMMNALNKHHVYVSARSTCHSQSNSPSKVLKALGRSDREALSSIRLSLDDSITKEDLKEVVNIILETKNYVQHDL